MKTKMMFILIPFITLFACTDVLQNKKDEGKVIQNHEAQNRRAYQFSSEIQAQRKSLGNQGLAFLYANTGRHAEALEAFDADFPPTDYTVYYDSSNYVFYPALDYISVLAKQYQVVIINEDHHVAKHRLFTNQLLQKLRKIGFNYFCAETLIASDTLLNERAYPLLNSGYFTAEPQYGNLIRQAISSGFRVFAYEASAGANGRQREIEQAKNIAKILKADPEARILVHCGYAHLVEDEVAGWERAMAGRLTEFTGIDPLTIDQVELTEHSEKKHENVYYQKMNFGNEVVPVNNGRMVTGSIRHDGHPSDVFVYHPRTRLVDNRPDWLFKYYKPFVINEKINLTFPVIVKVFLKGEDELHAVPFDVVEITRSEDTTALALLPGKNYKVRIESNGGGVQHLEISF